MTWTKYKSKLIKKSIVDRNIIKYELKIFHFLIKSKDLSILADFGMQIQAVVWGKFVVSEIENIYERKFNV